ncbi:MAG TPA: TetR/AcrR family transcriptional regulator [Anaerolineales bacterium]|nr:TetR/AcrR family transcriptional regulator [Anaerolineales bacterium]
MSTNTNPEYIPEDRRQRIIKAATQLFSEVGYSLATTRLIADAAGVNEVTLFRHFGNKKALLMACIEDINSSGFTATFEAGLSGDYSADILQMAQRQIIDMRANVEVLRMLLCDARSIPELRQVLLAGGRSNLERLSNYFQRQVDAGVVRQELSAQALAIAFDSLFSSSVLFEYVFQDSIAPRQSIDELVKPLADLFARGTARHVQ